MGGRNLLPVNPEGISFTLVAQEWGLGLTWQQGIERGRNQIRVSSLLLWLLCGPLVLSTQKYLRCQLIQTAAS